MWEKIEIKLPDLAREEGRSVAMGDIDLDGKTDLVVATAAGSAEQSGVWWLRYSKSATDPNWDGHDISGPQGIHFGRIELTDIDGDGDLDVLTSEKEENLGVIWYENPVKGETSNKLKPE